MDIRFMSKDDEIVRIKGHCTIYDERLRGLRKQPSDQSYTADLQIPPLYFKVGDTYNGGFYFMCYAWWV